MQTHYFAQIETPLGLIVAEADEHFLYGLQFVDTKKEVTLGKNKILSSIEKELAEYFAGRLQEFKTPVAFRGTHFQVSVWQTLQKVPFGKTTSYADLAYRLGHPKAVRAVANALGANQHIIIVGCHRILRTGGALGGFGAGIHRKKWLLAHEMEHR